MYFFLGALRVDAGSSLQWMQPIDKWNFIQQTCVHLQPTIDPVHSKTLKESNKEEWESTDTVVNKVKHPHTTLKCI